MTTTEKLASHVRSYFPGAFLDTLCDGTFVVAVWGDYGLDVVGEGHDEIAAWANALTVGMDCRPR